MVTLISNLYSGLKVTLEVEGYWWQQTGSKPLIYLICVSAMISVTLVCFLPEKNNILDLMFLNMDAVTYKDMFINSKLSDHNLVMFDININISESSQPAQTKNL